MSEENATGYVYILKNDSMPGLIKIGKTSRNSYARAQELSATTGVPIPFEVAFELRTENYEALERRAHEELADYRLTSKREFFEYPVDKAAQLLEALNDGTAPEPLLDSRQHFLRQVLNLFKKIKEKFFSQRPDETAKSAEQIDGVDGSTPETPEAQTEGADNNGNQSDTFSGTSSDESAETGIDDTNSGSHTYPNTTSPTIYTEYTEGNTALMNAAHEIEANPNLNGKPYYSEDNGFYWASNHRGIAECVPQHIKRIIHNEELEIVSTRDELTHQINRLRDNIDDLEDQKTECEREINTRQQILLKKKEELAELEVQLEGLEVQLNGFLVNRIEPLPVAAETPPEESNGELFNMTDAQEIAVTPDIDPQEEIHDLIQKKSELEQAIDEKKQILSEKKIELAGLAVELQSPTEAELNPLTVEASPDKTESVKGQTDKAKWVKWINPIISTVFFFFLAVYLFIFYASAVDKAFFLSEEKIQAKLSQETEETEETDIGLNDIVNPGAISKAFQGEWNLFVIMFPFVFLAFAIALDYFWERGRWLYGVAILLAALTLVFDAILAIQISQKIHEVKIRTLPDIEPWQFRIFDINMWTVIFCGFVVSMLVSIMYHVTRHRWRDAFPIQETSEDERAYKVQIETEKTKRQAKIAVLEAAIANLDSDIERMAEKENTLEENIKKIIGIPIESRIAVLNIQVENLGTKIQQFNSVRAELQQKIENTHTKIREVSTKLNKRIINRSKLESQVNQFLIGWFRFVVHNSDSTSDIPAEIERIKQVASNTVDYYYQGVPASTD